MSESDTQWLVAHLGHGWKSFAAFLLECTRRGVRLDEADLRQLEQAKAAFDEVIRLQRAVTDS